MKRTKGPLDEQQTLEWIARYRARTKRFGWIFFILLQPVVFGAIWIGTGELNGDVFLSWLFFLVLSFLLAVYASRRAGKAWRGEVVDKRVRRKRVRNHDDEAETIKTFFEVVFETTRGKRIKLRCRHRYHEYLSVGDAVIKPAGFHIPEKEHPDGNTRACIACGNTFPATEGNCPSCRTPLPDIGALKKLSD